jgi:adenosylmethionine-8-amino-7-oxononanoate aminotransferase
MSHVFQRYMRKPYPVAVAGDGPYIIDRDGRRYLDAASGAGVSSLGYSDAAVADAIARQARQLAYVYNAYFTTEPAEQLAQALVEMTPAGLDWVFFGSGGSESMDGALKMALQFHIDNGQPSRRRFIARRQSYHGCAMGGLAVSGNVIRRMLFEDVLMPAEFVSPCYAYREQRAGESDADYVRRLALELEQTILRVGPHTVAAFVAEPVVGATNGAVPALAGYFKAVKAVLDRYGILLIADEILTGSGRTGTYLSIEQDGVTPDLVTLAKGLGAGYLPISAILVSGRIFDTLADRRGYFIHGHTYNASATPCAAALAVITQIRERGLLERVQVQGARLRGALAQRLGAHPHVGDIRGRGLLLGLELVRDRETKSTFDPTRMLWAGVQQQAMQRGLICYPMGGTADGMNGDHILLAPPFIIDDGHIEEIVDKLAQSIDAAVATLPAEARR